MSEAWAVGLLAAISTIVGGLVAAAWTTRHARQEREKAERAAFEDQADELLAAVLALRSEGLLRDHLWANNKERARSAAVATVLGAAAFFAGSHPGREAWGRAAGAYAVSLAVADRDTRLSALRLAEPLKQVHRAAPPFMRHPDEALAAAAERILTVVEEQPGDQELQEALRDFGVAVRRVTAEPGPRVLWAPWRRREALPSGEPGRGAG